MHQGNDRRDEFAIDCPHRHVVCRRRDFHRTALWSTRKNTRFRGVLGDRVRASGPETADSDRKGRHWPGLSLWPTWTVRFRSRFAHAGFGDKESSHSCENEVFLANGNATARRYSSQVTAIGIATRSPRVCARPILLCNVYRKEASVAARRSADQRHSRKALEICIAGHELGFVP